MTALCLRGAVAPSTLDIENRTFEAIASTGADVRRPGYIERLALEGVELPDAVPVLDSHRQDGLDRVLGVVTAWRREAGRLIAQVRLSERAQAIIGDIAAGIIRGVSLGYQVTDWRDTRGADGTPIRTATRWRVHELSLVPVPADPGATVRSKEDPLPDAIEAQPEALANRAQVNQEIRGIAALAHLSRDWADALIDRGACADEARAQAFAEMAKKQPAIRTASVGWSSDDPVVRTHAMADAVYANLTGKAPEGAAQSYMHVRGFHDIAREVLGTSGLRTSSYGVADLIARAMETADFPVVLGNAVGRFVRAGYEAVTPGILALAQDRMVPDFKQQSFIAIHGPGVLTLKPEGDPITYGDLDERYEQAQVATWAQGLAFSREAMINDDRGAFTTVPTRLGTAARNTELANATALLTSNAGLGPALVDTNTLFHATHGNLAGTAAAISVDSLAAGRLAMRSQKDSKNNPVNVTPSALLVPASKETLAQQVLAPLQPTVSTAVNPFSNLGLVVEPRLSGNRWYLVAGNVEGLVVLRLEGRAGPQVEPPFTDFETKDLKFSVLNDFAVAFIDYRGWYTNAGA